MKVRNVIYLVVIALVTSLATYSSALAQCKEKKAITKACKPQMKPYNYDGMAYNDIQFDNKAKVIDLEFTAFAGEHYKLLFCKSDFQEKVVIKIYDKNKRNENRSVVYDSSKIETNIWGFEPPRSGNYFIEYEVPASSTGIKKNECMVLLIGYK